MPAARRAAHGEFGGDPAAERAADEMNATQIVLLEKIEIEIGEISDVVEPLRRIGCAEARVFRNDDVELFRQPRHAGQPNTDAAAAVQKQERRSTAAAHETDAATADRDHLVGMVSHCSGCFAFASRCSGMLT